MKEKKMQFLPPFLTVNIKSTTLPTQIMFFTNMFFSLWHNISECCFDKCKKKKNLTSVPVTVLLWIKMHYVFGPELGFQILSYISLW